MHVPGKWNAKSVCLVVSNTVCDLIVSSRSTEACSPTAILRLLTYYTAPAATTTTSITTTSV